MTMMTGEGGKYERKQIPQMAFNSSIIFAVILSGDYPMLQQGKG